MAIANKAFLGSAETIQSPTLSHTPDAAGNPRLAVAVVAELGGTDTITGIDYGTEAMIEVTGSPISKTSGEAMTAHMYYLGSGIPTGTQTITFTGVSAQNRWIGIYTFTAAEDCSVNVVDNTSINGDAVTNPTGTLALGGVTSVVIQCCASGQLAVGITTLTNWTQDGIADDGVTSGFCDSYDLIASTDVTIGWDQTSDDALAIAAGFREGGGTSTPNPFTKLFSGPFGGPF